MEKPKDKPDCPVCPKDMDTVRWVAYWSAWWCMVCNRRVEWVPSFQWQSTLKEGA